MIRSVLNQKLKQKLASVAKVSTRTIPTTLAAANEMPDTKLRRLFEVASSLIEEKQQTHDSDESMVRWLAQRVRESDAKVMAELLNYDAANLPKVVAGKRRLSRELRKRIIERMTVEENGFV